MTVAEVLKKGALQLLQRDQGQLEAELLLAHSLGWSKEELFVESASEVDMGAMLMFEAYMKRLLNGEPVAYITNLKNFYGYDFFVDPRVLIPRPETEMLVDESLKFLEANSMKSPLRILEIGSGSGCISISVARALQDRRLDLIDEIMAIDISHEALEVARLNAQQQGVDHLIRFVQSDLLEFSEIGENFDLIVTNPPYIGLEENDAVAEDVQQYEPALALFAGKAGFDVYDRLFEEMADKQISFSLMLGEFGAGQSSGMEKLLQGHFSLPFEIKKDLAGIDRIFSLGNN